MPVFEEHYANNSVWPRTEGGRISKAKSLNAVTHLVSGHRKKEGAMGNGSQELSMRIQVKEPKYFMLAC